MTFDIRRAKRNDTATFKFLRLSPDRDNPIELHTRHLGNTNEAYVNAAYPRKPLPYDDTKSFAYLTAEREQDLQDLAAFCVTSWNVTDNGAPVPCTPEKVLAFLRFAIENGYDDEVNAFRAWAKIAGSFREIVSSEDLGKE